MTQENPKRPNLNIDTHNLSDAEYIKLWASYKIEIRMVEKIGQCRHNVGDTFIYDMPTKRPSNVCYALLHVLDLYTWRVALGFPSWNADNRDVYRTHCPDGTGTVWEMRQI